MYKTISGWFSDQWSWTWSDNELSVAEWLAITFVGLCLIAIGIEIYLKIRRGRR